MRRFFSGIIMIFFICNAVPVTYAEKTTVPDLLHKIRKSCTAVQSMRCLFIKEVNKEGKEIPKTSMTLKYLKNPETIFVEFIDRYKGQKCLYVDGENDGKMVVRPPGVMNFMKVKIDPAGEKAMEESLEPITEVGFCSVIKKIEAFYKKSLTNERFTAEYEENISEDGGLFHVLKITSVNETDGYVYIHINRDSFLPYKIHLKCGKNIATYTYKNLEINKPFTEKDFKI